MRNLLTILVDGARAEKTIVDLPSGSPRTRRSAPLPFVEYLRTEGATWTHLNAVSSRATPNVATVLTGALPTLHGVRQCTHALPPDLPAIAELLRDRGYHTYAETTGGLSAEMGFDRGFDHYRCRPEREYVHRGFIDRLKTLLPTLVSPWFLCLHFREARRPYQNPEPFGEKPYGVTPYDRSLSLVDHVLQTFFQPLDFERTVAIYCGTHGSRLREDYEVNRAGDVLRTRDRFVAEHAGEIDLEAWYQTLRQDFDETTARIYGGGVVGHGFHVTEDQVRIPLIVADGSRCAPGATLDDVRSQCSVR